MPAMIPAAPITPGGISADFDPLSGIIRMVRTDFRDRETTSEHVASLSAFLESLRSAGVPIRIVADLRETYVLSPDQLRHITSCWGDVYQSGDSIALVIRSSLLKQQIDRPGVLTARGVRIGFFRWYEAADGWLARPAGVQLGEALLNGPP